MFYGRMGGTGAEPLTGSLRGCPLSEAPFPHRAEQRVSDAQPGGKLQSNAGRGSEK